MAPAASRLKRRRNSTQGQTITRKDEREDEVVEVKCECEYRFEREAGIPTPDEQFWNLEDEGRKELSDSQKKKHGFDDRELWGLDYTIASFIYPRLMRFREIKVTHPSTLTSSEWSEVLLKMAEAFKLIIIANTRPILSDDEYKAIDEGLDLFREYYHDLWD